MKIENNPFAKGFRDNPERSYENSLLMSSHPLPFYPPIDSSSYPTRSEFVSSPPQSVHQHHQKPSHYQQQPQQHHHHHQQQYPGGTVYNNQHHPVNSIVANNAYTSTPKQINQPSYPMHYHHQQTGYSNVSPPTLNNPYAVPTSGAQKRTFTSDEDEDDVSPSSKRTTSCYDNNASLKPSQTLYQYNTTTTTTTTSR